MASSDNAKTTRREFTRRLAVLAAAPMVVSPGVSAADKPPADPADKAADALLEAARARFGGMMPEDHFDEIRGNLRRQVVSGQLMKKPKLSNGDEPAFSFRADLP